MATKKEGAGKPAPKADKTSKAAVAKSETTKAGKPAGSTKAPGAAPANPNKVKKEGPGKVRGTYRRGKPKDYRDGINYESKELHIDAEQKLKARLWPLFQARGGKLEDRKPVSIVIRVVPSVDPEASELEPALVEEDGELELTSWAESFEVGLFGAGASRTRCILFDKADIERLYGEDGNPVDDNPYMLAARIAKTNPQFSSLRERDERVTGVPPTLAPWDPCFYFQGYVCYVGEETEFKNMRIDVEQTLSQPPTVFRISNKVSGRQIREEIRNAYWRKKLTLAKEPVPEALTKDGKKSMTLDFTSPDPAQARFLVIRGYPAQDSSGRPVPWYDLDIDLLPKFYSTKKEILDASLNGRLTAQVLADRFVYAQQLFWFPETEELAELMAHKLRTDPQACALLSFAWSERPEFMTETVREALQAGLANYQASESHSSASEDIYDGGSAMREILSTSPKSGKNGKSTKAGKSKQEEEELSFEEDEDSLAEVQQAVDDAAGLFGKEIDEDDEELVEEEPEEDEAEEESEDEIDEESEEVEEEEEVEEVEEEEEEGNLLDTDDEDLGESLDDELSDDEPPPVDDEDELDDEPPPEPVRKSKLKAGKASKPAGKK